MHELEKQSIDSSYILLQVPCGVPQRDAQDKNENWESQTVT